MTDVDTTDLVTASVDSLSISGTSDRSDPDAPTDAELLAMLTVTPSAILDGTEQSDTLSWDFDSGSETFDYLATGETLILEYTVKATDDDGTPLSDTETVTITITGTDDDPIVTGTVTGDVLVISQGTVRITGEVGGSLRGIAREVIVEGEVGDDVAVVAATTRLNGP